MFNISFSGLYLRVLVLNMLPIELHVLASGMAPLLCWQAFLEREYTISASMNFPDDKNRARNWAELLAGMPGGRIRAFWADLHANRLHFRRTASESMCYEGRKVRRCVMLLVNLIQIDSTWLTAAVSFPLPSEPLFYRFQLLLYRILSLHYSPGVWHHIHIYLVIKAYAHASESLRCCTRIRDRLHGY